jgi:hypothetical protein
VCAFRTPVGKSKIKQPKKSRERDFRPPYCRVAPARFEALVDFDRSARKTHPGGSKNFRSTPQKLLHEYLPQAEVIPLIRSLRGRGRATPADRAGRTGATQHLPCTKLSGVGSTRTVASKISRLIAILNTGT